MQLNILKDKMKFRLERPNKIILLIYFHCYRVQYTILEGKPYVSGLANYQDSIEDGLFWFIYRKPLSSNDDPVLVEDSK